MIAAGAWIVTHPEQVGDSIFGRGDQKSTPTPQDWPRSAQPVWEARPFSRRVRIVYADLEDHITTRKVDIEVAVFRNGGPWRFDGYCHKRQEARSFLITGILELYDETAGTSVPQVAPWLESNLET